MSPVRLVRSIGAAMAAALALMLAACGTATYRGHDSGIDGVLWRKTAAARDGLAFLYSPTIAESTMITELERRAWQHTDPPPDVRDGGVIVYDLSRDADHADFSVFVASGPRPDVPTDAGTAYGGPSQVYTCYRLVDDGQPGPASWDHTALEACPAALVEQLPDDTAFASSEVFAG